MKDEELPNKTYSLKPLFVLILIIVGLFTFLTNLRSNKDIAPKSTSSLGNTTTIRNVETATESGASPIPAQTFQTETSDKALAAAVGVIVYANDEEKEEIINRYSESGDVEEAVKNLALALDANPDVLESLELILLKYTSNKNTPEIDEIDNSYNFYHPVEKDNSKDDKLNNVFVDDDYTISKPRVSPTPSPYKLMELYEDKSNSESEDDNINIVGGSSTYTKYGNTYYGSEGDSYTKYGNTTYGSNGDSYSQYGNTLYGNDGDTYTKYGNTIYGNDGTSYTKYGNTTYGSDGSSFSEYGNTIYSNP